MRLRQPPPKGALASEAYIQNDGNFLTDRVVHFKYGVVFLRANLQLRIHPAQTALHVPEASGVLAV
jgi:hypothetical protein